jgi:RHS repeat-associated protein
MINIDGTIFAASCGFGFGWSNAAGFGGGAGGNYREFPSAPVMIDDPSCYLVFRCAAAQFFDKVSGSFVPRDGALETLTENTTNKELILADSTGQQFIFHSFDTSLHIGQRGRLKSQKDANGNTVLSNTYNGSGQLTTTASATTTGGTTTTVSTAYTYLTSGSNSGRISTITRTEQVGGGSAVTVRTGDLTYYDGTTSNGTLGDLKSAVIKDGSSNTLESHYFRYWTTTSATGYPGALKYAVTGEAYERLVTWAAANSTTVDAATGAQVAVFADLYLEFDAVKRITRLDAQGADCSMCSGGIGTYTYSYDVSPFAEGYNSWKFQRTETRPDGSVNLIFSNYVQEPLLIVHQEGGLEWKSFFNYDSSGRLTTFAAPSAISGYDATKADLLHNQSGNYQHLRDSLGVVGTLSYYTSTTATESTAGGVSGYLNQTAIQRGETGTSIPQGATQYFQRTANSITVNAVANTTAYRNSNGTGGQTTGYAWTWNSGTVMPASLTVTLPTVTTAQNGPNSATSGSVVADSYGRPVWQKDPGGFISYVTYDDATWAVTKFIADVDTTQTSTFANLPSGWSTPSGGGLHLTTVIEVDDLGRPTKVTDAVGNITYTVFDDDAHEMRVYPGWNTSTNAPTGPTIVRREDRARGYRETLTMSATPNLTSSRPNGTESIANVESLVREVLNEAGQTVYVDEYFDLTGTSYSQSSVTLGTSGTNYNRTTQAYDKNGLPNRTLTATGTIYRTYMDGQGRPVSTWVGTDDTPTTGFWSPSNLTGTDMVQLSAMEYDGGGVGDGNLTKSTEMPGSPYANRDTAYSYSWRNYLTATKSGVEVSESTSVNRPINYFERDNLGQVIVTEMYDGDTLSITTDANTDGVPDRATSSAMRAKATTDFDELGHVYKTNTAHVDPSNGTVSSNSLVAQQWRNSRGMVIKTLSPGGVVSKAEYNGIGWNVKSYVTDGGGDSGYGDADDVTSDNVLSQDEITYDSNGNAIFSVNRERFHDETGTGALGTPSTGNKARVSYGANYFDKADRLTDVVNVGTNGGGSYSRPGSVPSRSDTVLVNSIGYNTAGWQAEATDPMGRINKTYFDLAGRTTKAIENYVNGVVSDADDKTVEYTYHANNQMKTLKAYLTSSTSETTEWILGITSPVVSNDTLKEMRYPDASTGASSSSEKDAYTYDQLGNVLTFTDRNGNVHTYSYDILGRQIVDAITTLGSGVDGAVRRTETAYDTQGNAYLFTSYDSATSGSIVNQVQRAFDGLGNLIAEWQAVGGAVNTSTSPKVQYAWTFAPSGSNNDNLLSTITYPNGRVLTHAYDSLGRLTSISDGATVLESYTYLGFAIMVKRAHAQPGMDLSFIKLTGESDADAGDKYIGLDRFGRIADNRWLTATPTDLDRRQYGHDRNSNRLYFLNTVSTANSELYTHDGFSQIISMDRGTLNGSYNGLTGAASRSQDWDFDGLGNWDSVTTNGGSPETRGHNKQNEITSISGATTPTYDANGNLTTDETGRTFKYDAWNRLVEVKNSGGTTLATYAYDALGRRVRETRNGTTTDLFYSSQWQVIEERVSGAATTSYAWSPVYVDAMIARDRDTDANGSLDERLYVVHDANFNIVALVDTSGALVERFAYDAFGVFAVLTPAWGSRASSSYAWTYLHQGGRWDGDGGIYYFRHRGYGPTIGRWLQRDPIGFWGGDVNMYRNLSNSPMNRLDPMGLSERFETPPKPKDPWKISCYELHHQCVTQRKWWERRRFPICDRPVDESRDIGTYNCAGLAFRDYQYWEKKDVVAKLKSECKEGDLKKPCPAGFGLKIIYYDITSVRHYKEIGDGLEFEREAPADDYHIVGMVGDGKNCVSKNGKSPIEEPGRIDSFAPTGPYPAPPPGKVIQAVYTQKVYCCPEKRN